MNTFTITNTKIFHHNNPPNDDRDVNHWQVGYGYHKETKCSSHPKKSCHDVAKHVRIKMKIMILIISSRSHLPTHERSVTRSQRKSVTRFLSRSADFYLFFFPMCIFLNSLEISMVFVSHVLDDKDLPQVPKKECFHVPKTECSNVPIKAPVSVPLKKCWEVINQWHLMHCNDTDDSRLNFEIRFRESTVSLCQSRNPGGQCVQNRRKIAIWTQDCDKDSAAQELWIRKRRTQRRRQRLWFCSRPRGRVRR